MYIVLLSACILAAAVRLYFSGCYCVVAKKKKTGFTLKEGPLLQLTAVCGAG